MHIYMQYFCIKCQNANSFLGVSINSQRKLKEIKGIIYQMNINTTNHQHFFLIAIRFVTKHEQFSKEPLIFIT